MLFGTKIIAIMAALSSVALAIPAPEAEAIPAALEKRNCPRYPSFGGAQAIAGLYLGAGNNKSRQLERLIEETIALLTSDGKYENGKCSQPECKPENIYLHCDEDGEHWNWKREALPNNGYENCDNQYPYKHCSVKCKTNDYC